MKEFITYLFEDDGSIPNNPDLPLLVYPDALEDNQTKAEACKKLLESNGWSNAWVNGIFSYHHYHSTTHEVLAVINGSAMVKMGGEEGEELSISEGDAIVIPAGVGHRLLTSSNDFRVVGAYPGGRSYDLCTGEATERPQVLSNIKNVPLPEQDPVSGNKNPLYKYWLE
ncbi:MAG TPA: hypothetical protein DD671_17030 [Balneolaceae bacterium]|nr:hypothetical protein [Balneolaceae bacterium]